MKTEIYLVSKGAYSDYNIEAVFDTKEKAELYMKRYRDKNYGFNDIETFILNPIDDIVNKKLSVFRLNMFKNGDIDYIDKINYYAKEQFCFNKSNKQLKTIKKVNDSLFFVIYAKSEKHAIKIANERRSQIIALNLWNHKEIEY